METSIESLWKAEKCPIVNGIIYPNGSVKLLNPKYVDGFKRIPEYSGITTIKKLSETREVDFTYLIECECINVDVMNLKIYCGGAGLGGDGFVAVSHDDELMWIAFFEYSNPMIKVEWKHSKVIAYSNVGDKWIFDVHNPEFVKVQTKI
ncbi:MAG TPA: hypothetical protein VK436_10170 [Methanocella sp.]|nr:hypothetical protein [Methanocella sp.]